MVLYHVWQYDSYTVMGHGHPDPKFLPTARHLCHWQLGFFYMPTFLQQRSRHQKIPLTSLLLEVHPVMICKQQDLNLWPSDHPFQLHQCRLKYFPKSCYLSFKYYDICTLPISLIHLSRNNEIRYMYSQTYKVRKVYYTVYICILIPLIASSGSKPSLSTMYLNRATKFSFD